MVPAPDQILIELPEDAEDPVISKFDLSAVPVMELAVSAPRERGTRLGCWRGQDP